MHFGGWSTGFRTGSGRVQISANWRLDKIMSLSRESQVLSSAKGLCIDLISVRLPMVFLFQFPIDKKCYNLFFGVAGQSQNP